MSDLNPYFNSPEVRLEFYMEVRKALMQEVLNSAEAEGLEIADLLNNMIFAVDKVFERLQGNGQFF